MIEPDSEPAPVLVLFSLRSSLGNPRLDSTKFKKSLIQYTVNTAQYFHQFGVSGLVLPDGPWTALNLGVPTPRPEIIRPIFNPGDNAAAMVTFNNRYQTGSTRRIHPGSRRYSSYLNTPQLTLCCRTFRTSTL